MSSSENVHTPRPLKINELWQFFPETVYREGEPDSPALGPFRVRGDYKVERKERDVPVQRFLVLKSEEGCTFPKYEEYAMGYPEKLIAADLITFERKGSALRIRTYFSPTRVGVVNLAILKLDNWHRPFRDYVLYEKQVEGTWIPVEVDGEQLKP
jgi:hypothetical protein